VNQNIITFSFTDKKFEKLANDDRKLVREFGKLRAAKIKARLAQLRFATTLEEVRNLPGNYHELTNNRKGQWDCDLDQPYKFVFTPHENLIPTNKHGQYVWMEITGVEVIAVVKYFKHLYNK
jgi:proteic killer suppression protein